MGILIDIGLLSSDGTLTVPAKNAFITEVLLLLEKGNNDGRGLSLFPLPLPPVDPVPKLFWFDPQPLIFAATIPVLPNKDLCPTYHDVILDGLYAKTAQALDCAGGTPLFIPPSFIVDPTFLGLKLGVELEKGFPPDFPKLYLKFTKKYPTFDLFVAAAVKALIETKIPDIPKIPSLPKLPDAPNLILPDLILGLIKIPFQIIIDLMAAPLALVPKLTNPLELFSFVFDIGFGLLKKLLELFLTIPPTIIATLLVYLKNVCAIVVTDLIALTIGPGQLSKAAAVALGLIL